MRLTLRFMRLTLRLTGPCRTRLLTAIGLARLLAKALLLAATLLLTLLTALLPIVAGLLLVTSGLT